MNCPECGDKCSRDEVDIGVGVQCGPWGCESCGWVEYYDNGLDDDLEPEEDDPFN